MRAPILFSMLLFTVLSLLGGCSNGEGKQDEAKKKLILDSIMVIFKDAPNQQRRDNPDGSWYYTQDPVIYHRAKFQTDTTIFFTEANTFVPCVQGYDTLKTYSFNPIGSLRHLYGAREVVNFLLVAGDTVLITYDQINFPIATSLCDSAKTAFYQLCQTIPHYRFADGYTSYFHATESINFYKTSQQKDSICRPYQCFADSLRRRIAPFKNGDDVQRSYYDYYTSRLDMEELIVSWKKKRETYASNREAFLSKLRDADSLLAQKNNPFSEENSTIISTMLSPNKVAGVEAYMQAWIDIFTAALPLSCNTPNLKNTILSLSYLNMTTCAPLDTLIKYEQIYEEATGDSSHNQWIAEKMQERNKAYKADLKLESLKGDQLLFQDVLKKHRGKVIYVDYWASWCAPCRREMPGAKKLREEYKGKDVVFLYLSLNDTPEEWRAAVKTEQTDYLAENYIITNGRFAKMIEELNIKTVPRFMIYDRSGKLVEPNAPRPSTDLIRQQLDSYLNKK